MRFVVDAEAVTAYGNDVVVFVQLGQTVTQAAHQGAQTLTSRGRPDAPGVIARGTFGHSPGHMAFELRDGSESLMVVGDSLGNHHVAFAKPDWITGSDQDGAMAAQTRVGLLDQITDGQMRIAGFHLPGGLGHVERRDDGYRFVAEA